MNAKFTAGQLAKLTGISKQTLLFYDKKDVFKPKLVDKNNGYRYYTADQLEILDSVLILKEMGLSLAEIKEFMQNRTADYSLNQIKLQLKRNLEKIERLKLVSKRLEQKIKTIESYTSEKNDISVIAIQKPQFLAIERVNSPNTILQLDIAYKKLLAKASKNDYKHNYQIGAMINCKNLCAEKFTIADFAFIPIEKFANGATVFEKLAGEYMRGFHTGTYEDIGETYKKILNKISKMGYEPLEYSFEYCILDSLTSKNSLDYVTEIQIPIKK